MAGSEYREKLEFRKLLGRVSDGLGLENVKALKNLCYDTIGERKREEIDSGIQLFNSMIEGGMSWSLFGRLGYRQPPPPP